MKSATAMFGYIIEMFSVWMCNQPLDSWDVAEVTVMSDMVDEDIEDSIDGGEC